MKESMGGVFMLRIFLIIFVVFFIFVCISAVYARAFRVKNGVIDIIEQYEGINDHSLPVIDEYIKKMGYSCYDDSSYFDTTYSAVTHYVLKDSNINISGDLEYTDVNNVNGRYNIQVCVDWDIPFISSQGQWIFNAKTEIIRNVVTS